MAKAIYEKRKFTDKQTGETVNYEVYGIVSVVDGERTELSLKNLSPAEKIAFKMVLTGSEPENLTTTYGKTTDIELENFTNNIEKTPADDMDEDWLNKLS